MADDKTQTVTKASSARVKVATREELERVAESLVQNNWVRVDDRLDQITRIVAKYDDEEIFNSYKLAAKQKSSHEITKELASVLAESFESVCISPRHFDVEELERIVVDMYYADMVKWM